MNPAAKLSGKIVIVTGAARGIGAAAARRLIAEGACVMLADVLDKEGAALAAELGERAQYVHLDVREEADWDQAIAATLAKFGRIDVLINNAGVQRAGAVAQMQPAEFRFIVDVNFIGPYLGMRAVIPKMLEAGGGSIINVASVNGLVGAPGFAAYAGSKHALVGMTRSVAIELGATGIRVNAICPGVFNTEMVREAADLTGIDIPGIVASKTPMKRVAGPEEVAGMVVYLASDDSSYCTGSTYAVDGGLTAGFSLM